MGRYGNSNLKNNCTSRVLQNSVSIATSTLFTMVTQLCQTMDSSRQWLTIVADNNEDDDDEDDHNEDDNDDDGGG